MDFASVLARIDDLPPTFKRPGDTYRQWANALSAAVSRGAEAGDAVLAQLGFADAAGRWLDCWGLLFGLPRHGGEGDAAYRARITGTLTAAHSTPVAITSYLTVSQGVSASVSESLPSVGWSLAVATPNVNIQQIAADANVVRPAGVPFALEILRGGLFLSTHSFLGRPRASGAWLVDPVTTLAPSIPRSTNSAQPLLPTTFLTDPTLNG